MKKIESTRDLNPGALIRIYKKGFGYGRVVLNTNTPDYMAVLADKDVTDVMRDFDQLDAYLWVHNDSSYEFQTSVIGRIVKEPLMLFLEHSDKISFSSERKCIKAAVNIPVKFFIFDPKSPKKSVTTEDIHYLNGTVTELSDREALILSNELLPDNVYIFGHIIINGAPIELIGRKQPAVSGDAHLFSIEFKGVLEKERHRILDYVYTVYRE
jgi:hypothetical protein